MRSSGGFDVERQRGAVSPGRTAAKRGPGPSKRTRSRGPGPSAASSSAVTPSSGMSADPGATGGESGADSHGHIAKDQNESGKDHRGAMTLATAANARVFAPPRQIMDERDAARGTAAIQEQLVLDQMLLDPSVRHPLWDVVMRQIGTFQCLRSE